jgi:hypothetical protein
MSVPPPPPPPAAPTTSILAVPMPIPGTKDAPVFSGTYPTDFLLRLELHAAAAAIDDKNKLVDYIYHYSSDKVKEYLRFLPEFDIELPNKTWDVAKKMLLALYGSTDVSTQVTEESLAEFVRLHAAEGSFRSKKDVESYYLRFSRLSAPLLKNGDITSKNAQLKFVKGIPKSIREWFLTEIAEENRTSVNPPTIADAYEVLLSRFDRTFLFYEPNTKDIQGKLEFDSDITTDKSKSTSSPTNTQKAKSSKSAKTADSDIDALTKALEDMKLNQAKMIADAVRSAMSGMGSSPVSSASSTPSTQTSQMTDQRRRRDGRCIMCGKTAGVDLDHALGIRNCAETKKLLDRGLIRFDEQRNRYVMPNGAELPYVPTGTPGGVAHHLLSQESSGRTLSTSAIELSFGDKHFVTDDVFAVYPISASNPALRSGKDTSNRFDPKKRPEEKGKGPDVTVTPPTPPPAKPQPPKANVDIPPPPNPINRQDGWQGSLPSKPNPKNDIKDVDMSDGSKKTSGPAQPGYRYTSDVQEMVSVDKLTEKILDIAVPVTLREIVGNSPALQKTLTDLFRTKRVYTSNPAEYSTTTWVTADGKVHVASEATQVYYADGLSPSETIARDLSVENIDPEELERFFVRYAMKAVVSIPTEKFMAMTCGYLLIDINGKTFKVMIDTGSELNIAGTSFYESTGLPLDFEGMNWRLKGIHGQPERLRGLCVDVPQDRWSQFPGSYLRLPL